MKFGSTLNETALPKNPDTLYQTVLNESPNAGLIFGFCLMRCIMISGIGWLLRDAMPIFRALIPYWAAFLPFARLIYPLFALLLFTHNLWISTAELPRAERRAARCKMQVYYVLSLIAFPFLLPIAVVFLLYDAPELYRSWRSYFVYERQPVNAPGVFHSPIGSQRLRTWLAWICFLVLGVSDCDIYGVFLGLFASLTLAPFASTLWGYRNGTNL